MRHHNQAWTEDDDDALMEAAGSKGYLTADERLKMSKKLGRTFYSIGMRIHRLGLHIRSNPSKGLDEIFAKAEVQIRKGKSIRETFAAKGYTLTVLKTEEVKKARRRLAKRQQESRKIK